MKSTPSDPVKPTKSNTRLIPDPVYLGSKVDLEVRYFSAFKKIAHDGVTEEWYICLGYTDVHTLLERRHTREPSVILSLRPDEVGIPHIVSSIVYELGKMGAKDVSCVELDGPAGGNALAGMIQRGTCRFSGLLRERRHDWVQKVLEIFIRFGYIDVDCAEALNSPYPLDIGANDRKVYINRAPRVRIPIERRRYHQG